MSDDDNSAAKRALMPMPGMSRPIEVYDGAERYAGAGRPVLSALETLSASVSAGVPGVRLAALPDLAESLAATGSIGLLVARHIGAAARPVRAVLFDKSADNNWRLGWHQDRTIVVKARIATPDFGPWSIKAGLQHVAPPIGVLARMMTIRIHLDPVSAGNAPLLFAPGSQHHGLVREEAVGRLVEDCGIVASLADVGDVWLYATLILHASEAATVPSRRRVLQIDYSADRLPGALRWLGVD